MNNYGLFSLNTVLLLVSGPVVVGDGMGGAAMYDLVCVDQTLGKFSNN